MYTWTKKLINNIFCLDKWIGNYFGAVGAWTLIFCNLLNICKTGSLGRILGFPIRQSVPTWTLHMSKYIKKKNDCAQFKYYSNVLESNVFVCTSVLTNRNKNQKRIIIKFPVGRQNIVFCFIWFRNLNRGIHYFPVTRWDAWWRFRVQGYVNNFSHRISRLNHGVFITVVL